MDLKKRIAIDVACALGATLFVFMVWTAYEDHVLTRRDAQIIENSLRQQQQMQQQNQPAPAATTSTTLPKEG